MTDAVGGGTSKLSRASGVLLHPTSLPPPPGDATPIDVGSGDFGAAPAFLDWLASAKQSLWQVLPLNPVGRGHSPYTSVSAHAGNPWLISPQRLLEAGWLDESDVTPARRASHDGTRADFARSVPVRAGWLRIAAERFFARALPAQLSRWRGWCEAQRDWLEDYALFMALRTRHGEAIPWTSWPAAIAARQPVAVAAARRELIAEVDYWRFVQWCFDAQWAEVRALARERGVRIVGDLPIYVAFDSSDVWAAPEAFDLAADRTPRAVAGVPPDYFSTTGQLWGNPLYRWEHHAADGYAWWAARLRSALRHADVVRIDHFRGFASFWEVPAGAASAIEGHWRPGPGRVLFTALERALGVASGKLPVLAEDLGLMTPDVPALVAAVGVPGMRVLQFGFGGGADNVNLPHNFPEACVAYTGTHDNDTTRGWFDAAPERVRRHAQVYLKTHGEEIAWDAIHAVSQSVARLAIYPMQDVLSLGSDARMNQPSVAEGQWGWRFGWRDLEPWHAHRLAEISVAHGRHPG